MIKSPIRVIENIGCYCSEKDGLFIIGSALDGYSTLLSSHNNTYIPYICKSNDYSVWEIGIGLVKINDSKLVVERIKVIKKSNAEISFSGSNNAFYVFANEHNFNTGLNNCVILEDSSEIQNINCDYIYGGLETTEFDLPSAKDNQGLSIGFKNISNTTLTIKDPNNTYICYPNNYIKFISTGEIWLNLYSYKHAETNADSFLEPAQPPVLFSSLSGFSALNYDSSGNFVVTGVVDRSLVFTRDGKLGLNIPSGSLPQTSLHILNYACQEGIRLENRNSCYPANLTLYHKPSTLPTSHSVVSTFNLSSKNSANTQINYAQIRSKIINSDASYSSGEFAIAIQNNGSLVEAFRLNPTGLNITVKNNSINMTENHIMLNGNVKFGQNPPSGNILVTDSSGNLVLTNISSSPIISVLDGPVVVFTGVCS
jgi:hypothetical protein